MITRRSASRHTTGRSSRHIQRSRGRTAKSSAKCSAEPSAQSRDLLLGHEALDILGLAPDAVARASVGLDRQTGDNGINGSLLDRGAALRPLQLVMYVVIDRV